MNTWLRTSSLALLIAACAPLVCAHAATRAECERQYTPRSGQHGKDVIWVPTPDSLVTAMLKAANTTAADRVFDLGSGDGKIAIAAAREFGAKATGVEYNPDMVKLARCYAQAEGVADKVQFIEGDIFKIDFSSATVLTLYLLPDLNEKLKPTILKMRPGTRVVSHSFLMGDWRPDARLEEGQAYLWIVPANVAGTWQLQPNDRSPPLRLQLAQTYQDIEGTLANGTQQEPLREAALTGDAVSFMYIDPRGRRVEFKGRLHGEELKLTTSGPDKPVSYTGKRT